MMDQFIPGKHINQIGYRSFQPGFINRQWRINNVEIITLLSQADRQLGRLDMFSEFVPNIELFIRMYILKEATKSSKIEGTKTNIRDAILDEKDIPSEQRNDWNEVQNYITAMQEAIENLSTLPLSSRLIKQIHKTLLKGVRGAQSQPGEFRRSQNWIGGASIQDATFIPPVHTSVPDLMSDLEKFIHNREIQIPELIKAAILHYQFETIHPFLDGNGRIGRLLITLYLVQQHILKRPVLYLSDFFERNRQLYYDNLMRGREDQGLSQWIKFFLVGIIETARSSIHTFEQVLQLRTALEKRISGLGSRAGNAHKVLEYLFKNPVISAHQVREITRQSPASTYSLIAELERMEILQEKTGGKRNRIYVFEEYLKLYQ